MARNRDANCSSETQVVLGSKPQNEF